MQSLDDYLAKRIAHASGRAKALKLAHGDNPGQTHSYHGGYSLGYWEGLEAGYQNALDELTAGRRVEDKFVLIDTITGNIHKQETIKRCIDVTRIAEIRECNDYFGFKTTEITFNNGKQAVYINLPIEVVFDNLKSTKSNTTNSKEEIPCPSIESI